MDSLTRYAQALREIGLARGEAPAARGYPPSALAGLAPLLERAGPTERGTITGLYTVLVEGDDPDEPVADAARSFLDGHIELSRRQARAGLYPAVDPAASISRLQERVVSPEAYARAVRFRALWAAYEEGRDLIQVGAYRPGSDPRLDEAVQRRQVFEALVAQGPDEVVDYEAASSALAAALGDGDGDEGVCG
jgi:flagellar biosynthesis/type III secretory pathway ATPase